MDTYKIIRDAIKYNLGNLIPVKSMIDSYMYDNRVLFQFPLRNKKSINIYVIDSSYNLYSDFRNAALKVYENGGWIVDGDWIQDITTYLTDLDTSIQQQKDQLEASLEQQQYQDERALSERIVRFAIMWGSPTERGILLPYLIPAEKTYDDLLEFVDTDTIEKFMEVMFDAQITEVINE